MVCTVQFILNYCELCFIPIKFFSFIFASPNKNGNSNTTWGSLEIRVMNLSLKSLSSLQPIRMSIDDLYHELIITVNICPINIIIESSIGQEALLMNILFVPQFADLRIP